MSADGAITHEVPTRRYAVGLQQYLAQPDEAGLSAAYELGRRAVEHEQGMSDIVIAHTAAIGSIELGNDGVVAARAFLLECLAPLEMAYLGYREANESLHALNAELEARIAQRTRALEEANAELEAFTYSASHDLRAPLRSIDGFSGALERELADTLDDRGRELLGRVRGAAQRMGKLIDALLNLSRLSQKELSLDDVDISAIAGEVAAELREQYPERNVDLGIATGMRARADRQLVRVLLVNLLGNAFKYTAHEPGARIAVGSRREGSEQIFFISDNGAGFDMAYAEKLFAPFQRLHRDDEFPGIGIGLATVQRVVGRHRGRIWAQAAVGKGATFNFSLARPE